MNKRRKKQKLNLYYIELPTRLNEQHQPQFHKTNIIAYTQKIRMNKKKKKIQLFCD